ncbi:MAG: hypothetical protein RJA07_787 [Bacteroidota bacterium]|jgi:hypothetical protein
MPELLRLFGLRFFFYSNDHEPPHVHVRNADGEARFIITPVQCIENNGLKDKDIYLAEAIIVENADLFLKRWQDFFKK